MLYFRNQKQYLLTSITLRQVMQILLKMEENKFTIEVSLEQLRNLIVQGPGINVLFDEGSSIILNGKKYTSVEELSEVLNGGVFNTNN